MVFSSAAFIFGFLPATLILYKLAALTRRLELQNLILLVCSLVFYAWGGLRYLLLLLLLIVLNWGAGLGIALQSHKRLMLIVGLTADILVLLICKYFNFFVANVKYLLQWGGLSASAVNLPVIPLPIGISFFTFQIMSYLIDLYREEVHVQKNPAKLALYVMMFPQLIAGPIVRYADVEWEIDHRVSSIELEVKGTKRFILGFAKKVFLANATGAFADIAFGYGDGLNFLWAWLGALCYALQIYMDFSAYSDMAIGLGWIFGFHFNENFKYPYISASIKEFWRRWHISLSGWFRDYVYIPLGGSRNGARKTYRNLLIVFLLTGFWHGAAWQFVIWGLYHGFFLVLERTAFGKILKWWPAWMQHLYACLVVMIGWVFFRADTLTQAAQYLKCMFFVSTKGIADVEILSQFTGEFLILTLISVIICMPIFDKLTSRKARSWLRDLCYLAVFGLSVCYMLGAAYNPFIYFRF